MHNLSGMFLLTPKRTVLFLWRGCSSIQGENKFFGGAREGRNDCQGHESLRQFLRRNDDDQSQIIRSADKRNEDFIPQYSTMDLKRMP